jgi:hypothetical protein
METAKKEAILAAITAMKKKGVTAIKIELEAQMNRSYHSRFDDSDSCMEFIMEHVAEATGEEYEAAVDDGVEVNPLPWITYAQFYNDGSVDSELTFTVPLKNPLNIFKIPKVLEAFRALGRENSEFRVTGAGMHMAVLFSKDCSYPRGGCPVNETQWHNFQRSMTQLLPALFFLASDNGDSRALRYRQPTVSTDKYSAIAFRYDVFEYRVFDTCYDNPLAVLDNIVVIANSLKYLSTTYKNPGIDKLCKSLMFGVDNNNRLDRFYTTINHIDVLEAGLELLKPSYFSLSAIKRQRKFSVDKVKLQDSSKEAEAQAKLQYEEYSERFEWGLKQAELRYRADLMARAIQRMTLPKLRGMSFESLMDAVEADVQRQLEQEKNNKHPEDRFIRDYVNQTLSAPQGNYELRFA